VRRSRSDVAVEVFLAVLLVAMCAAGVYAVWGFGG
jgi:hypothetical protein